jgi:hypothetical protein
MEIGVCFDMVDPPNKNKTDKQELK